MNARHDQGGADRPQHPCSVSQGDQVPPQRPPTKTGASHPPLMSTRSGPAPTITPAVSMAVQIIRPSALLRTTATISTKQGRVRPKSSDPATTGSPPAEPSDRPRARVARPAQAVRPNSDVTTITELRRPAGTPSTAGRWLGDGRSATGSGVHQVPFRYDDSPSVAERSSLERLRAARAGTRAGGCAADASPETTRGPDIRDGCRGLSASAE